MKREDESDICVERSGTVFGEWVAHGFDDVIEVVTVFARTRRDAVAAARAALRVLVRAKRKDGGK